jgi:hypothetical protein
MEGLRRLFVQSQKFGKRRVQVSTVYPLWLDMVHSTRGTKPEINLYLTSLDWYHNQQPLADQPLQTRPTTNSEVFEQGNSNFLKIICTS